MNRTSLLISFRLFLSFPFLLILITQLPSNQRIQQLNNIINALIIPLGNTRPLYIQKVILDYLFLGQKLQKLINRLSIFICFLQPGQLVRKVRKNNLQNVEIPSLILQSLKSELGISLILGQSYHQLVVDLLTDLQYLSFFLIHCY